MISKEPVNYHIAELIKTENLMVRTRNICIQNSLTTLYLIIEYYLTYNDFRALPHCGIKTNDELIQLCNKYIKKYGIIKDGIVKSAESRNFDALSRYCIERFNFTTRRVKVFYPLFDQRKFPFFRFSLLVLRSMLTLREFYILEHHFDYFTNKRKLTLREIGERYGITSERARQISRSASYKMRKIIANLCNDLTFLRDHVYYPLTLRKDYLLINQSVADAINMQENLNCTSRFYARLLSFLHQGSYHFFQEYDSDSRNYYFVNRKFASVFDFEEFLFQLRTISSQRIQQSYTINLATFISGFFRSQRIESQHRILSVCADIAMEEFGYTTNSEWVLTINRNTHKRLPELIEEVLKEYGRPMHLREILQNLMKRNLKTPASPEALRSSILNSSKFIAIGKTSTYSLSEWPHIKTGTIRKLAKEFLEQRQLPAHISEITQYIATYRKAKEQVIYYNLKIEPTGIFKIFPKRYIGLSNRKYPPIWTTNPQLTLL